MPATALRRRAIGASIRMYRKVPGRQVLRKPLMRLLARDGERIADVGPFRMHVDLGEMIESRIYYTGTWEPETVATLERLAEPGDTVIDVGAHVGFITMHLATLVGASGHVHAFEATRWAHERLEANLSLNHFEHVRTYNLGVSDHAGTESLMLPRGYRLDGTHTGVREDVEIVALDALMDEIGPVGLLKTDTDGMESKVLGGARKLIERDRPKLIFEVSAHAIVDRGIAGEDMIATMAWLEGLGYELQTEAGEPVRAADILTLVPYGESTNVVGYPHTG